MQPVLSRAVGGQIGPFVVTLSSPLNHATKRRREFRECQRRTEEEDPEKETRKEGRRKGFFYYFLATHPRKGD